MLTNWWSITNPRRNCTADRILIVQIIILHCDFKNQFWSPRGSSSVFGGSNKFSPSFCNFTWNISEITSARDEMAFELKFLHFFVNQCHGLISKCDLWWQSIGIWWKVPLRIFSLYSVIFVINWLNLAYVWRSAIFASYHIRDTLRSTYIFIYTLIYSLRFVLSN